MRYVWLLLMLLPGLVFARQTTEILFEDTDPGEAPYLSRVLILGDKVRLDYGQDAEDFTLYDRRAKKLYVVTHSAERITEIPAGKARLKLPKDWRLAVEKQAAGAEQHVRLKLNDKLCLEIRAVPGLLPQASRLLGDLRRALAANQSAAWQMMPEDMRDPCSLWLDIVRAGIEYDFGLPLTLQYGDGRSRIYRSHVVREAPAGLFELPAKYQRFKLSTSP
ncbi:MAG: hypothetical protein HXY26_02275 [Hydrogenophilaceae bacterium]|nr:hypothetical protein [Hydrogenophilaceae bacterium]